MPISSNKGQVGVSSIRLNGRAVSDLPLGQGNQAKDGLADAIRTELENKVGDVLARYPRLTVGYVDGVLKLSRRNIEKFSDFKKDRVAKIAEYRGLIRQCQGKKSFRQIEDRIEAIAQMDLPLPERVALVREAKRDIAPYDAESLEVQIETFQDDLQKLDEAIQQENDTIAKWTGLKGELKARDAELRAVGATKIE